MLPSWVSSWRYRQMLDYTGKFLPGANTLAYLALLSATEKKFYNIDSWISGGWKEKIAKSTSIPFE
jgi:hypothetical protein